MTLPTGYDWELVPALRLYVSSTDDLVQSALLKPESYLDAKPVVAGCLALRPGYCYGCMDFH